jgi:hypothetical protein
MKKKKKNHQVQHLNFETDEESEIYNFYKGASPANSRLIQTTRADCHRSTLLPPDNGLQASPKHLEM